MWGLQVPCYSTVAARLTILTIRWNAEKKRWDTARFGSFLSGPVNTYRLDLQGVTKLRYVPWANYYRNFYTSELRVFTAPTGPPSW